MTASWRCNSYYVQHVRDLGGGVTLNETYSPTYGGTVIEAWLDGVPVSIDDFSSGAAEHLLAGRRDGGVPLPVRVER